MSDGPEANLLKEYEILRGEITENSRLVASVFIANTTVTAALIGFGLSREVGGGAIFLAPLAVLIPSLFFIASQMESTTTISQYLRIVLEPRLDVRWQSNWYELRKHQLLPKPRKYAPAVSGLYGALSLVCLALAGATWNYSVWLFVVVALTISTPLLVAVIAIRQAFSPEFREATAAAWRRLLELQAQTGTTLPVTLSLPTVTQRDPALVVMASPAGSDDAVSEQKHLDSR